ncbi:solute carrier family 12 member 3-like [Uloborus diversus]|uniref:solute carrier family 12 member 3-like n=1 Tax=Uloborus diversus TaxID=327109 RepID=UPI00240A19A0|nr:solute carrier family 12 member 3-like [Uloborus diversus]
MKPNILMMGFKEDWQSCDSKDMLDYFYIIHETLNAHLSLCILRIPGGTSFAKYFETEDGFPLAADLQRKQKQKKVDQFQELKIVLETVEEEESVIECHSTPPPYASIPKIDITRSSSFDAITVCEDTANDIEKDLEFMPPNFSKVANMFHVKQPKGTIDVWWLYDDGGLTLLLPYIMTTRNRFRDNKLRVFSVAQDDNVISEEQINLAALLNKFRIPFSDLSVLSSVGEPLHEESSQKFETIISKWLTKDESRKDSTAITRTILNNHKMKDTAIA